jgi:hypothetical protein
MAVAIKRPGMQTRTCTRQAGASVAGIVSLGVLAVGLALTVADVPMAWVVWPLGYGVALPLAIGYAKRQRDPRDVRAPHRDRLARLKDRYVRGEIDDREFEAELETVLEEGGNGRP